MDKPDQERKELLDRFLFDDGPNRFTAEEAAKATGYSVHTIHDLLGQSSPTRPENLRTKKGFRRYYYWPPSVEITGDLPGPLESGRNPEEVLIEVEDLMYWIE